MLNPLAAAVPLGLAEFTARIERLGCFEARPFVAVAVSGGPDSLALAILADRWARQRGGQICALSVDHRLRPESGAEINQLAGWLAARSIRHRRPGLGREKAGHPHPGNGANRPLSAAGRVVPGPLLSSSADRSPPRRPDRNPSVTTRPAERPGWPRRHVGDSRDRQLPHPASAARRSPRRACSRRSPPRASPLSPIRAISIPPTRALGFASSADFDRAPELHRLRASGCERADNEQRRNALLARAVALHPAGFAVLDPKALLAAPRDLAEASIVGVGVRPWRRPLSTPPPRRRSAAAGIGRRSVWRACPRRIPVCRLARPRSGFARARRRSRRGTDRARDLILMGSAVHDISRLRRGAAYREISRAGWGCRALSTATIRSE